MAIQAHSSLTVYEKIIRMARLSEYSIEKKAGYRIVQLQLTIALITTGIAYWYSDSWGIAAANLWGAITAALSAFFLVVGLSRFEIIKRVQPQVLLLEMYRNSLARFFLVIVSLALAMGLLKLNAASVLCGFVVAQAVPIMARILMIKR